MYNNKNRLWLAIPIFAVYFKDHTFLMFSMLDEKIAYNKNTAKKFIFNGDKNSEFFHRESPKNSLDFYLKICTALGVERV